MTDDYGILTEADLLYETQRGVTPYKLEDGLSAYQRWQCFETKKVLFKYSTWRDDYTDFGRGAILCDYSFNVTDATGIHHIYVARRAKELIDCRELFSRMEKREKKFKIYMSACRALLAMKIKRKPGSGEKQKQKMLVCLIL